MLVLYRDVVIIPLHILDKFATTRHTLGRTKTSLRESAVKADFVLKFGIKTCAQSLRDLVGQITVF